MNFTNNVVATQESVLTGTIYQAQLKFNTINLTNFLMFVLFVFGMTSSYVCMYPGAILHMKIPSPHFYLGLVKELAETSGRKTAFLPENSKDLKLLQTR